MKFSKMEIEKVEIKTELPDGYLLQEEESSEQVNQKPYKCGICGHRTTADTLLKVHMKMHFVKRLHQCQICKESFGFVTELNAHVLTHNKDLSGFRCEHCGKECFTEEDLHKHYRIHTKEKPYKCKLCMRSFSEEFYLRAHERSHHGEEYTKRTMMQDGTFVDPNVVKHLSDDTVRDFQCEICQKCFSNEQFLKIHYEAHLGEEVQNSIFSFEENIPKTMLLTDISDNYLEKCRTVVPVEEKVESTFECTYIDKNGIKCSRRFGEQTAFDLHVLGHETSNEQKIFCHICKIYFKDDLKLLGHMRAKHGSQADELGSLADFAPGANENENSSEEPPKKKSKTGFKCTVCSKIFPVPAKLRTHLRTHTGEKPFKCETCQKCFGTAGSLKDHSYLHMEERPFKCTLCNKGFVKNNALENHIRSHTGEKPYECNICHKKYATPVILNQHLLAHSKKPFKCDVCDKSFIYLCTLKYHMVIHTDSKPFKCSYCDKSFSIRNSLHLHEREHTGIKLHKCSFCGKTFTTVGSLKKHERTHTGEKPYVCHICNRGFTQSSALNRHVDSHTGEKPYICHICKKGFSSATYLKVHLRLHKGEPPYRCIHCGKTFSANLKYRTHVKTHKKDKDVKKIKTEDSQEHPKEQNISNSVDDSNAASDDIDIVKHELETVHTTM